MSHTCGSSFHKTPWVYVLLIFAIANVGHCLSVEVKPDLRPGAPMKERAAFGDSSPPFFDTNFGAGAADWLEPLQKEMQAAFEKIKSVNEELQKRIGPARESVKNKLAAAGHKVFEGIQSAAGQQSGVMTSTSSVTQISSDGHGPPTGSKQVVSKTTTFNQQFP